MDINFPNFSRELKPGIYIYFIIIFPMTNIVFEIVENLLRRNLNFLRNAGNIVNDSF